MDPCSMCTCSFQQSWKEQPSTLTLGHLSKFQRHRSSLRFFPHTREASHMYPCHCFFQRGGTSFSGHGSTFTLEHFSLIDTLHLGGTTLSPSSSLFWGGLFPLMGFFPSPIPLLYILDVCHNGGS